MPIVQFDHYTLRSQNVDVTARFYVDVMGFRVERLDAFDFPMRLLFLGDQALVHVLGAGVALDAFLERSASSLRNCRTRDVSNFEHLAFNATGLAEMVSRLENAQTLFVERALEAYGVVQLLFDDPEGVEIEVNFPISERSGQEK